MSWFKTDDKLHDHRKVRRLAKDKAHAMGVWVLAGSWCAGLDRDADGFVPSSKLREFGDTARHKGAKLLAQEGLWHEGEWDGEHGYFFHEWVEWGQESAAEKAIKRAQMAEKLISTREATKLRVRKHRAEKRAAAAENEPKFDGTWLEVANENDVIGVTEPPPVEDDYYPSELDVLDSETGGSRQCNADGNAVTGIHPRTPIPSSGDLGGGGADPYVGATAGPPTPRKPGPGTPRLVKPVLLRPDDADPKLCNEHWPLRYRDTHESIPKCTPCQTRRLRVEAAEAQAVDVEAEARALRKQVRDQCRECDEHGWKFGPDGLITNIKHDCIAAALAAEHLEAAA